MKGPRKSEKSLAKYICVCVCVSTVDCLHLNLQSFAVSRCPPVVSKEGLISGNYYWLPRRPSAMSACELCLTQILASFVFNLFSSSVCKMQNSCLQRVWLHFDPRVNIGHGIRLMVLALCTRHSNFTVVPRPEHEPQPVPEPFPGATPVAFALI